MTTWRHWSREGSCPSWRGGMAARRASKCLFKACALMLSYLATLVRQGTRCAGLQQHRHFSQSFAFSFHSRFCRAGAQQLARCRCSNAGLREEQRREHSGRGRRRRTEEERATGRRGAALGGNAVSSVCRVSICDVVAGKSQAHGR